MINNNKFLSRDRVATGRNVVTIKRNLIKIDSLLKERLVLTKVRQGILRQQEQNRIRRQREEDLESLQSTGDQTDTSDKQGGNFLSGLVKAILGLTGLFLPQLLRLINFLRVIAAPVKKMATLTFNALSTFLSVGMSSVTKIKNAFNVKGSMLKLNEGLAGTITTKFNKFEFALNTFVNALLFAGAMQTLSNLPDLKQIKKFLSKINIGSKVTTAPIRGKRFDDLGTIEELFKKNPLYQKLNAKDFKAMNIQYSDLPLKERMANAFEMNKRGIKKFPEISKKGEKIRLEKPIPAPEEFVFNKAKNIQVFERFKNQDEIFAFFRRNEIPSVSLLRSEANIVYRSELKDIDLLYQKGLIDDDLLRAGLFDINIRYDNTIKRIDDYAKEIFNFAEKFGFDFKKIRKLNPKIPKSIFEKLNLINPVTTIFNTSKVGARNIKKLKKAGLVFSGQTTQNIDFGYLIEENTKNIGRDIGAAARRFYPPGFEYDLIQPSMFERGRSALFETGEFLKGIDKTMVDFATKQTDKIANVITSGPLKGFTQGAKGMLKRAVGESIGLVPFLGDLIGLLLDIYLFGEIPERAGYKAVGGILGGFVGALIGSIPALVPFGGPIIGSILGGIGGDILGGIVYDIVKGKDPTVTTTDVSESTVKQSIKEGAIKTFNLGGYTGKEGGIVHAREFVIDADSTLAVRQNAPGFLEDLNRSKGFESLEVLRNYASYETMQGMTAQFIPIPIPIPSKQVSPVVDIATGEVKKDLISSYHYARG